MTEISRGYGFVVYDYDGGARTFPVTFPFLTRGHVRAFKGEPGAYIEMVPTWASDGVLSFTEASLPATTRVTLLRMTPRDTLGVTFNDGGALPAVDLNKAVQQLLFITQETLDVATMATTPLPAPGPVIGDPAIQQLIDVIFQSPLFADLTERLSLIDVNSELIIEEALRSELASARYYLTVQLIENETMARATVIESLIASMAGDFALIQAVMDTLVTETEAIAIAETRVAAFRDGAHALLSERFEAIVSGTGDPGTTPMWSASWNLRIEGMSPGGTPVIGGIGLGVDPINGSQFLVMADKFAIIHPSWTSGGALANAKVPFVVGTVGGVSTVGINGQLVVDGSITANKITVNSLSAVTANAGTLNGGIFRTHVLDANGAIIDPLEFRAEMTNDPADPYPLWVGAGIKNQPNAVFYVKRDGSAGFDGDVAAPNIIGDYQKAVSINMGTSVGVTGGMTTAVHSFTLPPPDRVGKMHAPAVSLSVNFDSMVAAVVRLEWLNGSTWTLIAESTTPSSMVSGTAYTNPAGSDGHAHLVPPIFLTPTSTYATISGGLGPTASATQFRVTVTHSGSGARNVLRVTGFAFGVH